MSRLRNFPEKIYVGMDTEGKLIQIDLPEKVIETLRTLGHHIQLYTVPESFRKPRKTTKPALTPADTLKEPDNQPTEATDANLPIVETLSEGNKLGYHDVNDIYEDKPKKRHRRTKSEKEAEIKAFNISANHPISSDEPKWKCTACGGKTDTPYKIVKGQFKGMLQCPFCRQYTIVKNEVAE